MKDKRKRALEEEDSGAGCLAVEANEEGVREVFFLARRMCFSLLRENAIHRDGGGGSSRVV